MQCSWRLIPMPAKMFRAVTLTLLFVVTKASKLDAASPLLMCTVSLDPNPDSSPGKLVNCSHRALTQIPPGIPNDTTTLVLSFNKLKQIPNDAFIHLSELRELDIAHNAIHSLQHNAFRGLSKLRRLDLWWNSLTLSPQTYPVDVFKPLVSLEMLLLNLNTWMTGTSFKLDRGTSRDTTKLDFSSPVSAKPWNESASRKQDALVTDNNRFNAWEKLNDADFIIRAHNSAVKTTKSGKFKDTLENNQRIELGYPDEALSHLPKLRYLAMDGLTNNTLGPGFRKLTRLTHLNMNGKGGQCNLVTLNVSTLASVPHLTYLNISECNILHVSRDAFSSLQNLNTLDLSYNQALGFDLLGEAFEGMSNTKLKTLVIDAIVPARSLGVVIHAEQIKSFKNLRHLEKLQARFNRIDALDPGVLCDAMPPNLKHIDVNGNLFEMAPYLNDLACLENLEVLEINGLERFWIPPLRPPDKESESSRWRVNRKQITAADTTRYTKLVIDEESHKSDSSYLCEGKVFSVPPKMEFVSAKDFGLVYNLQNVKMNTTNRLKKIDLRENRFPILKGPLCGFHSVEELYLIDTKTEYINHEFFSGFPALRILNISRNRLREVFWEDHHGKVLSGLNNLTVLDLSHNDLGHLPNKTLIHLENLEELYLNVNGIGSFYVDVSRMKKLRHMDLSKNSMNTIPKPTRDHLDLVARTYNVTVNMTFNPIACICKNIDFLLWIRDSDVYFGTHYNYFCQQPDGSLIYMDNLMATITELERTCGNFVGAFVGASACCVIVVTLLLVALGYRFRWKLRYLYYASRLAFRRGESQQQQERQQQFQYDAFVSFATEDQDFVMGDLKTRLEDEQGLRLCIHTRDFMPGQYIASNIVDSVQRSRRTLVVLTRSLLASDWCHYELQMALMESVHTGRDVLLFLIYDHVPAHELPRDMLANLQATSYIEFPSEESHESLFWSRLVHALRA